MKAQPLAVKQFNERRVSQATNARQQAAERFRQRQLDAALTRLLKVACKPSNWPVERLEDSGE